MSMTTEQKITIGIAGIALLMSMGSVVGQAFVMRDDIQDNTKVINDNTLAIQQLAKRTGVLDRVTALETQMRSYEKRLSDDTFGDWWNHRAQITRDMQRAQEDISRLTSAVDILFRARRLDDDND